MLTVQSRFTNPGSCELTAPAVQPADKRPGHSMMVRHAFFSSLDWAALLTTTPPYVPDVSSAEDDSHFDIIEEVTTEPSITALKDKKEFKNLPFIGFSFTSDKVV